MSDAAFVKRLRAELPVLVEAGVIDEDTARRLSLHYPDTSPGGRSRLMLAFSVLGALLIGGGIILIIAHNWEGMGRPLRAVLSFMPLLLTQGLALWVIRSPVRGQSPHWREGSALGWHLGVAASIALVSQTYNLGGTLQDFLFAWALLSFPVGYLTGSVGATCLTLLVTGFWRFSTIDSHADSTLLLWFAAGAYLPFARRLYRENPTGPAFALFSWSWLFLLLSGVSGIFSDFGAFLPLFLALLSASFFLAGRLYFPDGGTSRLRPPWHGVGAALIVWMIFVLSYERPWVEAMKGRAFEKHLAEALPLALAALCSWLFTGWRAWSGGDRAALILGGSPLVLGAGTVCAMVFSVEASAILMNLYGLGAGVALIVLGSREDALGKVNGGMFLVASLAFLRFVDSSQSMIARALFLIAIGVAFLAVNRRLAARRRAA